MLFISKLNKLPEAKKGFVLLPKRRVVYSGHSWLIGSRNSTMVLSNSATGILARTSLSAIVNMAQSHGWFIRQKNSYHRLMGLATPLVGITSLTAIVELCILNKTEQHSIIRNTQMTVAT
ncbi:MAG: hypothetical protein ABIL11_05265, partial [Chloroflexota bacterium]